MNPVERVVRRVDDVQQRHPVLAFPFAVAKKFGDDQAGHLAALTAYYGFFSLFPLLIVAVTVLGKLLPGNPALREAVLGSALRSFPVIGPQIGSNVRALDGGNLTLVVAIVLSLWAGLGVVKALQYAMNTVWNVPFQDRPSFLWSTLRAIAMLAVLGGMTLASTLFAGAVSAGESVWIRVLGLPIALALNVALFLLAFRILTAAKLSWGDVLPGAAVGAVAWTALQALGGLYVDRQLKGASEVYGTFAVVIGLLAWIYLGAQVTLYAAEINVVRKARLWPRSVMQPPLTEADEQALTRYAEQERRRPEVEVHADVREEPGPR